MANGPDHALRLMIVDDSVEAAEAIVSILRNAGIAVRPLRPESIEELGEQLDAQAIDLVLAAQGATGVPLPQVLDCIKASGKDLPVVAVVDRVAGTAHFEVDDARARTLHSGLAARLSGYLVPRLVREVAGDPGKRPLASPPHEPSGPPARGRL